MKNAKISWKTYLFWIALSEGIGLLAALLTRENTILFGQTVVQPSFAPPPWLFPAVWTVLYALMGVGAARVSQMPEGDDRSKALNIFVTQLIVNFFWSLIFFNAQAYGFALLWLILLWLLIFWMIIALYRVDKSASFLQIPYLLWVTFAGYLNYAIWKLN